MKNNTHGLLNYLGKAKVTIQELLKRYPPEYTNDNKLEAYNNAVRFHGKKDGEITITRVNFDVSKKDLPLEKKNSIARIATGFYKYQEDNSDETRTVWYVNFADPMLFGYYDGSAFAQDEIQTLEMPLLASCMLFLDGEKIPGLESKTIELKSTVYEAEPNYYIERKRRFPTPYLIENVPYWISVKTNPLLADGTRENIYGRLMRDASKEAIRAGIKTFEDDLKNNIIAIAAPEGGRSLYTENQIEYVLQGLITAFAAAVQQTKVAGKLKTVIHSGNLGCGAFGGNKELMYLAQIYAASVTGVDELVMHISENEIFSVAEKKFSEMKSEWNFADSVKFLMGQNYRWNTGDGN
ncbi:MAG: hypothetical protein KBT11_11215 [Treponema sp.]|nr:hypothetical protein [Candidatus Treponema equifaecale]